MLKDYPAARVRLEAIAAKRLEKYKKAPLEKGEFLCLPKVQDMELQDIFWRSRGYFKK